MFGKIISDPGHFICEGGEGEQSPVREYLISFEEKHVTVIKPNEKRGANDSISKHLDDVECDEDDEHVPDN